MSEPSEWMAIIACTDCNGTNGYHYLFALLGEPSFSPFPSPFTYHIIPPFKDTPSFLPYLKSVVQPQPKSNQTQSSGGEKSERGEMHQGKGTELTLFECSSVGRQTNKRREKRKRGDEAWRPSQPARRTDKNE